MKIDFRIAILIARRSRLPSSRCTLTPWMTLRRPAPRQHWTIKGDFDFRGSKSGWGIVRCAAVAFSHCHCLFVQDPGEQGAKAPCSPLSLHCRIAHCPLSFFIFGPTGGRVALSLLSGCWRWSLCRDVVATLLLLLTSHQLWHTGSELCGRPLLERTHARARQLG